MTGYAGPVNGRPESPARRRSEPLPLWVGWTLLPLGWTAWIGFAYAGLRTRSRRLGWTAAGYALAAAASIGLTGIVGVGAGDAGNGLAEDVGTVLGLVTWAVGIGHALAIRHDVERRIELRRGADDALLERRHARELAATQPAAARAIGLGRPDLPDAHHAGLVDLNSAPAETIATLTGVNERVAQEIVATREQLGGFSSVEDLGLRLDLPGNVVEQLREHALLVPRAS